MTRRVQRLPLRALSVSSPGSWSVKAQQGFLPGPVCTRCVLQFHGIAPSAPLPAGPRLVQETAGLREVPTGSWSRGNWNWASKRPLCGVSGPGIGQRVGHAWISWVALVLLRGYRVQHRHWGWPCGKTLLQMKYNTSKIFGEMLEMLILKCISRLDEPARCWKQHVSGRWVMRPTHSWCTSVSEETGKSVSGKQCRVAQELGFNSQLREEEQLRWLCSIPVQAQGNRCESGKSMVMFFWSANDPTMEVLGFFWEWDWPQELSLVRLARHVLILWWSSKPLVDMDVIEGQQLINWMKTRTVVSACQMTSWQGQTRRGGKEVGSVILVYDVNCPLISSQYREFWPRLLCNIRCCYW